MKFFKKIILLISLLFSAHAFALNGEFTVSRENLIEGDIADGIIRIWPVENVDTSVFNSLNGKVLFGGLQLMSINQIAPSENNADVLEIKATFIVRSSKIQKQEFININNEEVLVPWKEATVRELKQKSKDFIIFQQSTDDQNRLFIVILAVVVLLIIVFIFKKYGKVFNKRKTDEFSPQHFNNIFQSASTREDFERIYALREKWIPLLPGVTPSHRDFFKTLNQHQYKKRWDNDELIEIKAAFDSIRRSFL